MIRGIMRGRGKDVSASSLPSSANLKIVKSWNMRGWNNEFILFQHSSFRFQATRGRTSKGKEKKQRKGRGRSKGNHERRKEERRRKFSPPPRFPISLTFLFAVSLPNELVTDNLSAEQERTKQQLYFI
ncbi:predicted protein [Arabidopsis lyrata subsp. lyrata]|uniref:Predicted protein n=1 Tax=Arabidopsis lyrata subsp. lyrata TaxID=81972 RepID=D7MLZ7_ARALL|nr:predicted protein [Arabidopsis lyrata subsp. lyrata]